MIVRKGHARSKKRDEPNFGVMETSSFSDSAGLTQCGAYLQTLQPGAKSSTRHWHEQEDEFLYVVSGQVSVVEKRWTRKETTGGSRTMRGVCLSRVE